MTLSKFLEKTFLMCLALGLTSRAIEKGVEAAFVLLGLIFGLVLFASKTNWGFKSILVHTFCFFKKAEFLCLTLALISFGISSYMGINPEYSIKQWHQVLAVFLGAFLLYLGLKHTSDKTIEAWPKYVAYTGAGFAFMVLLETLNILPIISENIRDLDKGPLHTQIRSFSSVMAVTIPFAWVYALRHRHKVMWILPTLMTAGAFACGGRAGWLALIVTAVCFLFVFDSKSLNDNIKSKMSFLTSFALGTIGGIWAYKVMVGSRVFSERMELTGTESGGSGRTDIWAFAWQSFLENPLIGIGVKGFRHLDFSASNLTSTMHPHNAILEILLETGLIGTLLIFAFAGIAFIKLIQKVISKRQQQKSNDLETSVTISLVAFATASMTLTSIFHAWWLTFFIVLYVLSLRLRTFK